jgi:hypothetical protein
MSDMEHQRLTVYFCGMDLSQVFLVQRICLDRYEVWHSMNVKNLHTDEEKGKRELLGVFSRTGFKLYIRRYIKDNYQSFEEISFEILNLSEQISNYLLHEDFMNSNDENLDYTLEKSFELFDLMEHCFIEDL